MSRDRAPRRGIVLLIVLSLLILFLLIGVTYVLSGSQFKRNASVAARYDQFTDPPQVLVQSVMMELIRGSNNARSGIQSQNLLEDMYGSNWYAGTIAGITSAAGTDANGKPFDTKGQFLEILGAPTGLGDGFFNGCVLTITDGPAQGISTRIVGYQSARGAVWVMPLVGYYPGVMPIPTKDHYLINGRQFSGTGAGYNPATGMCDAMSGGYPIALTPNPAGTSGYNGLAGTGGQNEEYDVADYQNPFLAFHPPGATKYSDIIPSFHRPALIAYWMKQQGKTAWNQLDPKLLAKIMWRPNALAHPIFASTVNPMFDPINGPWDVDTDGDGYPDAVWMDVGMPPGMDKDGRKYKMLVAYQVLDLDGRINTNVHGKVPASGSMPNNSGFGITPYEVAQSFRTAGQFSAGNFTPAELETVARQNDMDRNLLPGRLVSAGATGPQAAMFTTESYGVPGFSPVPNGTATTVSRHITDLVRAKLSASGITGVAVDKEIAKLIAPEMLAGMPLNLNRLLSDGQTNDDPVISPTMHNGPKQILARHLYVLLWLLMDDAYVATRYADDVNWNLIVNGKPTPLTDLEVKAKRYAQWAVNVVDYRDLDSEMTPFEYQVNPFNGWKVDGNLQTDEGANRGVVWGCEHPDLLLMEAFACHNRGGIDSALDDYAHGKMPPGTNTVADLDQGRLPQGTMAIKLFCPPVENTSSMPGDLYTNGTLDLERMCPDGVFPVWRMVTSLLAGPLADPHYDDEQTDATNHTYGRRYRIIWFTGVKPNATGNDVRIFYRRPLVDVPGNPRAVIAPGQYLSVASRRTTYFGSKTGPSDSPKSDRSPSDNLLDLPNAVVIGADRPPFWVDKVHGGLHDGPPFIGMNITEPMPLEYGVDANGVYQYLYYGGGEGENNVNGQASPSKPWPKWSFLGYNDAFGDPDAASTAANWTLPYRIFDDPDPPSSNKPSTYIPIYGRPLAELGSAASGWPHNRDTGTHLNWRFIHLQRLANPNAPYNESTNPYIAVDWMPLDMTLFAGEFDSYRAAATSGRAPDPADKSPGVKFPLRFASRQRTPASSVDLNVPWRGVFPDPIETPAVNISTNLNSFPAPPLKHNFAGANSTYPNPAAFPPITWNNRDYYSGHELLQVPAVAPQHLTTAFSIPSMTANGIAGIDPFNPASTVSAPYFGHLQNFFQYSMAATPKVANFYRILEYVTASIPLNAVLTKQTSTPLTSFNTGAASAPTFRPPAANAVSTYRIPGLLNVNAISSPLVWQLAMNGYPTPTWDQFVRSRRGYGTSSSMTEIDANYPSNFMGVFRAPQGANLVPAANMRRPGIYTGLMRPDPAVPTKPMFLDTTNTSFDTTRNPRWTFHGIERMSNLTTTRSSVFAVWITVGFFEAIPHTGAADATLWPDGYELGSELNADTGDVKRYRAFYIFDRSIPVGYERGQDHNVHKAILLSKFIE